MESIPLWPVVRLTIPWESDVISELQFRSIIARFNYGIIESIAGTPEVFKVPTSHHYLPSQIEYGRWVRDERKRIVTVNVAVFMHDAYRTTLDNIECLEPLLALTESEQWQPALVVAPFKLYKDANGVADFTQTTSTPIYISCDGHVRTIRSSVCR